MRRYLLLLFLYLIVNTSFSQAVSIDSWLKIIPSNISQDDLIESGDVFSKAEVIGDLNGDGYEDMAIGASKDDDGGTDRGAVWVLFLNEDRTVKDFQKISDTEGNFTGTLDNEDNFGCKVSSIGDLDGDNVNDLAVGAWGDDDNINNSGAVWILFMNDDGTVKAHQKISATEGGIISGPVANNLFGLSISALGDLDEDGIEDIVVGTPTYTGTYKGCIWILFLNTDGTVKAHQKINDNYGGFSTTLGFDDRFGSGLSNIGDIDSDGVIDIAVGAMNDDDGENDAGAVYILFLNTNGTVKADQKISNTSGGFTGTLDDNDKFGFKTIGIGDLDNDGINDIAVSAYLDDDGGSGRGAVWIIFLNDDGTVKHYKKISDTKVDFTGELDNGDYFGSSLSKFNTGNEEIVIGATRDDDDGTDMGAVWILDLVYQIDDTPPVPNVGTLNNISGECSVTVSSAPTATDNYEGTIIGITTDPLTYTDPGVHIITWTYDDGNGNTSTQYQTVSVNDDQSAPVADVTTLSDVTGECSAVVSTTPTATDNCEGTITATTDDPLTYDEQGTYTITWTYDDGNGYTSTQTQTVIVDDVTAPVADITSLSHVIGDCSATVSTVPTATDNCEGTITATTDDPLLYDEQGTFEITWTYDDGNGNTSSQSQYVIVDLTAPVADETSLNDITGECSATVSTTPTATDNCEGSITGTTNDPLTYEEQGTYTITWSYNDGNGNTSSQTQTVIIDDITDPSITCISNQEIMAHAGNTYTVSGTEFDPTETTDNCEVSEVENDFNNASSLSGAELPLGTNTIVWTVTDVGGNEETCSVDIVVTEHVGVETIDNSISIYPNPTTGKLIIKSVNTDIEKFSIKDLTGKIIIERKEINPLQEIDLSTYSAGVYFLQIYTGNKIIVEKIIKE